MSKAEDKADSCGESEKSQARADALRAFADAGQDAWDELDNEWES